MSRWVKWISLVSMCVVVAACSRSFNVSISGSVTTVQGSGVPATQTYEIGTAAALDVGSAFDVELIVGGTPSLVVETDDNLLELVEVTEEDGRLRITTTDAIQTDLGLKARLTLAGLEELEVGGAGRVRATGVDIGHLVVECGGAGVVEIEATVASASIDAGGAGKVKLAHLAGGLLEGSAGGAARVVVHGRIEAAKLDVSGDGDIEVKDLTGGALEADVGGSGSLTVVGRADDVRVKASGGAQASLGALQAVRVTVDASGAASVDVFATEALAVEASGGSNVVYGGDPPQFEEDTSSGATVRSR